MRRLLNRSRIWFFGMVAGGTTLVLEGCDPNVRDTVLGGVEGAATSLFTTLISAFFQSLMSQEEETATTVKLLVEHLTGVVA